MLFVSKRKNLRVIIRPTDRIVDSKGRPIVVRGVTAEFGAGRYATDDEEVIRALLEHPLKGIEFVCAGDDRQWLAEHQEEAPQVVTGARATVQLKPKPAPPPQKPVDLEALINQRVEEKLAEILEELNKTNSSQGEELSNKRTFKCSECKAIFSSGFEVAEHKKLVHPRDIVEVVEGA